MSQVCLFLLSLLVWKTLQEEHVKSYRGFSVLRLAGVSKDKNDLLKDCQDLTDNMWLCNKTSTLNIENMVKEADVEFITKDLEKEIDEEREASNNRNEEFDHQRYLRAEEIHEWLQNLADISEAMKIETIGQTQEGRDIHIVKINSDKIDLPTIFIDAGIHAREWISPAATLYLIEKLVKANTKGGWRSISNYQWHIVPLANPDGYEYSHTHDRMWRKNTVTNPGSECKGVDLNRNFAQGYGIGASKKPCSDVYKGTKPFSEKESMAIRDHIQNNRGIRAAVSIHSYGNVLIYPWGYQVKQHPRRKQLRRLASRVRNRILKKTNETYEIGTAIDLWGAKWGKAGGCTDDWFITQNISYSYTFELPGKDKQGEYGFKLLPRNIKRVGKQLLEGFTALARGLQN